MTTFPFTIKLPVGVTPVALSTMEIDEKFTDDGSTTSLNVKVMSWFAAWVLVENEFPLQPSEQTDTPNSEMEDPLSEELPHAVKAASRQDRAKILLREGSVFTMTKAGRPRCPRDGSRGLLSAKFSRLNTMHTQTYNEQEKDH